ncbi:MAG: copper-binding protein [Rubrivivax sp.]
MKSLLTLAATLLAAGSLWAQTPTTDGEITKIDKAQARVTLRHGEIKNLEMPGMTMTFRLADPKWLDGLAVGDRVRFAADKIGGNYTVTAIVKAK